MPFLFLLFWSLLYVLFAKSNTLLLLQPWPHRYSTGTLIRWMRQEKKKNKANPPLVYWMCALLAALPLLLRFPSYSCCYFLCLFLTVWCLLEAGETYPLHAGSSWHVSDCNVRHRQTWWRLMAVYSSVCAVEEREACAAEHQTLSFSSGSSGSPLSVTAPRKESEEGRKQGERDYALCTPPSRWQIVSSSPLQFS